MRFLTRCRSTPRSGEEWDDLQKQLKKAIQIVKKHGGENVTLLVTVIGGEQTNALTMLVTSENWTKFGQIQEAVYGDPKMQALMAKPRRSRPGRSTPHRRSNSEPPPKRAGGPMGCPPRYLSIAAGAAQGRSGGVTSCLRCHKVEHCTHLSRLLAPSSSSDFSSHFSSDFSSELVSDFSSDSPDFLSDFSSDFSSFLPYFSQAACTSLRASSSVHSVPASLNCCWTARIASSSLPRRGTSTPSGNSDSCSSARCAGRRLPRGLLRLPPYIHLKARPTYTPPSGSAACGASRLSGRRCRSYAPNRYSPLTGIVQ